MVLIELAGTMISSTKVIFQSISKAFTNAAATNAKNGNAFQKAIGGVFGYEFITDMTQDEARQILGFDNGERLTQEAIRNKVNTMLKMNDLSRGGSPYLNERFAVAGHVLSQSYQ